MPYAVHHELDGIARTISERRRKERPSVPHMLPKVHTCSQRWRPWEGALAHDMRMRTRQARCELSMPTPFCSEYIQLAGDQESLNCERDEMNTRYLPRYVETRRTRRRARLASRGKRRQERPRQRAEPSLFPRLHPARTSSRCSLVFATSVPQASPAHTGTGTDTGPPTRPPSSRRPGTAQDGAPPPQELRHIFSEPTCRQQAQQPQRCETFWHERRGWSSCQGKSPSPPPIPRVY